MTKYRESMVSQTDELDRLLAEEGPFIFLDENDKKELRSRVSDAGRKLEELGENVLTVGLMGGTGVGKSTLMNGLANEEISSTSHRRPHTEDVLVYRHGKTQLPPSFNYLQIPWREHEHRADEIRSVLLCDLPDYDSIMEEHRDTVVAFLETLDVLVWVLSPEKYADGRFYDFLKVLPKDRSNCYFVLNKTDIFFEDGLSSQGEESLAKITGTLRTNLKTANITDPTIYHVSAEEAVRGGSVSVWNQFPMLRREIFRDRDMKELTRIKAANIDVELGPVFRALEKEEAATERLRALLTKWMTPGEDEFRQITDDVEQAAAPWVATLAAENFRNRLDPGDMLTGPGRAIAVAASRIQGTVGTDPKKLSKTRDKAVKDITSSLKRNLATRRDRLLSNLYRQLSLKEVPEDINRSLNPDQSLRSFEDNLRTVVEAEPEKVSGGAATKLFRFYQYFLYGLLCLAFLLVLPGEYALRSFMEHPGVSSALTMSALAVAALFSPRGLAAMISLLLLSFLLGWRFFGRYRKLVKSLEESRARSMIGLIKEYALDALKEQAESTEAGLQEMQGKLSRIRDILKGR